MSEAVHGLQKEVETIKHAIYNTRTKHVNNQELKDAIRSLVRRYFTYFRPSYISVVQADTDIVNIDSSMQELLRCTQHRTLVKRYLRVVNDVNRALDELECTSMEKIPATQDQEDQKILETLVKINPSAAASYTQGLLDLRDYDRKSWRGTAAEFREALRELLDTMAPDKEVMTQPGFRLEPDVKGPTMKQKVVFILKSRQLSSSQVNTSAGVIDVIDATVGQFVRSVYADSSKATHTQVSKDGVLRVKNYVNLALIELLEIKT